MVASICVVLVLFCGFGCEFLLLFESFGQFYYFASISFTLFSRLKSSILLCVQNQIH